MFGVFHQKNLITIYFYTNLFKNMTRKIRKIEIKKIIFYFFLIKFKDKINKLYNEFIILILKYFLYTK